MFLLMNDAVLQRIMGQRYGKDHKSAMSQDGKAGPGNPWIGSFSLSLKTKKITIHEVQNKTSQGFTLTF